MGKLKKEPQYTKKAKKCKIALFDGDYIITGNAMFTAVRSEDNPKFVVVTITLVKQL